MRRNAPWRTRAAARRNEPYRKAPPGDAGARAEHARTVPPSGRFPPAAGRPSLRASGPGEETLRSIAETLSRHSWRSAEKQAWSATVCGCRPLSPGVLIAPDNATVPDMRPQPCPPSTASLPSVVFVEERGKIVFPRTKNFGGDMSYQFRTLAVSQKGDI